MSGGTVTANLLQIQSLVHERNALASQVRTLKAQVAYLRHMSSFHAAENVRLRKQMKNFVAWADEGEWTPEEFQQNVVDTAEEMLRGQPKEGVH